MKKVLIVIMALCFALSGLSGVANAGEIWFEAEWADSITSPLEVAGEPDPGLGWTVTGTPSNGLMMWTSDDAGDSNSDPPSADNGRAVYTFFATAGTYKIVQRTFVGGGSNSFWVYVHDSTSDQTTRGDGWIRYNGIPGGGYTWNNFINDQASGDPVYEFTLLHDGLQTLEYGRREDGCVLDCFVITDDLSLDPATLPDVVPATPNLPWKAENPTPADGAATVALSGTTLMWDAPSGVQPPQAITTYDIYFGDSWMAADPNGGDTTFKIGSVAGDGALEADLDALYGALASDTTYHWRVDAFAGNDANTAIGFAWSFDTVVYKPIITAQPAGALVWPGETVVMAVEATSGEFDDRGALSYQWHDSTASLDGETGSELVFASAGDADAEDYYCVVSNADGDATSAAASLVIKHMLAWYKLDNDVKDSSGLGPDGTIMNGPTDANSMFSAGVDGLAIGVNLDAERAEHVVFGSVGISGAMPRTISAWVKNAVDWDQMDDWQTIFGFTSASSGDRLSFDFDRRGGQDQYCIHAYGWENNIHEIDGEWHFLTATYDGTTVIWYADGEYVGQDNEALSTEDIVHLGKRAHSDNLWRGWVDDARVYDYALDWLEVAVLYTDVMPDADICIGNNPLDLDGDCRIGVSDLALFAAEYLECNIFPYCKP